MTTSASTSNLFTISIEHEPRQLAPLSAITTLPVGVERDDDARSTRSAFAIILPVHSCQ
jgi:hypothetical protein